MATSIMFKLWKSIYVATVDLYILYMTTEHMNELGEFHM